MIRRLFTSASILSLVLCTGLLSLWVRSWTTRERMTYYGPKNQYDLVSDGSLLLARRRENPFAILAQHGLVDGMPPEARAVWRQRALRDAEPHWDRTTERSSIPASWTTYVVLPWNLRLTGKDRYVILPHWALAGVAAILPTIWAVRLRRPGRRRQVGFCPTCGYDLRASAGRCPECGTPIPAKL